MSNTIEAAYNFGHECVWHEIKEEWLLVETGKPITDKVYDKLICPKCKKAPTEEGHDPCIKNLPGVKFACCGHGVERGYIWFENGVMIRGNFEISKFPEEDIE